MVSDIGVGPVPSHAATDPLVDAMDAAGYRLTEPRRTVAELIGAREGHFTAADLIEDARVRSLGIGRATIFRVLDLLTELEVLERLWPRPVVGCNASSAWRRNARRRCTSVCALRKPLRSVTGCA